VRLRTGAPVLVLALVALAAACAHASGPGEEAPARSAATPEEPKPVRADYGLPAAVDPAGVRAVTIVYEYSGFHENHLRYRLARDAGRTFRGAAGQALDEREVAALLAAVTDLHPSDGEKECTAITDWYPQFRVELTGAREVVLETRSNCAGGAPWSVVVDGDLFIQYDGKLGPVVRDTLSRIDPQHWEKFPDTPEAFTVVSQGRFRITGSSGFVPKGTRRAAPPAEEAYARSLQASDVFRKSVSGSKVEDLDLSCDLSVDAQCGHLSGEVTLERGGLVLRVPVTFADGTLERLELAGAISIPR
jgi:hypothetical protein